MTAHGDHKRTNVLRVLLTDPEVHELRRLCHLTGRATFSEVVRYALFENGLGAQLAESPDDSESPIGA